jgi:hypothetical protein
MTTNGTATAAAAGTAAQASGGTPLDEDRGSVSVGGSSAD